MSHVRLIAGVLIGTVSLAVVVVAALRLDLNPTAAALAWCLAVGTVFNLYIARKSRRLLAVYWNRRCTGGLWKRRFPASAKTQIRQFLALFAQAFSFQGRQLCFAPADRIIDIYRARHPDGAVPDGLELEALAGSMQRHYGLELAGIWHETLTLGELYEHALHRAPDAFLRGG